MSSDRRRPALRHEMTEEGLGRAPLALPHCAMSGRRAARREPSPTAYYASAPGRVIGRLYGVKAVKTPFTTPYQKGRVLEQELGVADAILQRLS